ncbi:hypothetical protein AMJ71_05200 [candidate division TA06 bacterium SM1_40]|uniref:Hydrogenase/sulfur reductase subunit alpha n=2 Tax=Bacteria division TA06 TaxID=1156500 RepID=A0A0S8JJQ6_UNCT6|nr:MAG: hypothetical protein AMJ82_03960 [candidate division TA06 bacterium SM23_40]KPL09912.1 MAG: hypothetical protein AMJ71_05200 [candidate division TA06 bacterium SM1_40]
MMSTKTITVGRVCRIEGHGGITVEMKDGRPANVQMDIIEGTRFFEPLLVGRHYHEVTPIVMRICAICSAVHAVTSLMAIEDAFGIKVSPQTKLLRDLLVQGGNIESHALHLFCLAVPDFLGYSSVIELASDRPGEAKIGLELKNLGNKIQEMVGGRAIHPVNAVVGGFGLVPSEGDLVILREELEKGIRKALATIDLMAALEVPTFPESPTLYAALKPPSNKFGLFGNKIVLSTGETMDVHAYKDLCNEVTVAYSHAKQSRFRERPFMVGALARVMLFGKFLSGQAKTACRRLGLHKQTDNILYNNAAQAVELVYSIERAIEVVDELLHRGVKKERPRHAEIREGSGTAASEAPRGTLYHSYTFNKKGRLTKADVITPTAQNCANIEKDLRASVERAGKDPVDALREKLQMVVRAYDPCISCSVHLIDLRPEAERG